MPVYRQNNRKNIIHVDTEVIKSFYVMTGKAESGNHNLQEKLDKYLILMTKVVSWVFALMPEENCLFQKLKLFRLNKRMG